ncbi:DUF1707 domain-containing protein [Gordonia zhaorongruii]|uniref:DUF1707 SHOCT-like domain-containing protein n=1 Tax=Gordonia zhaorongruii TaxID=2597659 RepID=UPI00104DD354|nr:DUF1707 domain-containing protein [Gordonia zhaorongruii]
MAADDPDDHARADDDLRVGTPERERAISLLNDAFSGGYLDVTEFEDRSGHVYGSRIRSDLRRAVADLPTANRLFPDAAPPVVPAGPAIQLPQTVYDGDWKTVRRKGAWRPETNMLFSGSMGSIDLDFSAARMPAPLIDIELQVSASTVKIKLGPDQELRVDGLVTSGWSSIKDKAGSPQRAGGQIIQVRGALTGLSGMVVKRSRITGT